MFSWVALMVASIVSCSIFAVAAFIFLIMWIVSIGRGGLQKSCPGCSALVPSAARFCTHCGKAMPQNGSARGGHKTFPVLFGVCLIIMGLSAVGIVYSTISSGIGDSEFVAGAVNLKHSGTSTGWNISFDSVHSGWLKKNIHIESGSPKTLHVQSHLKSGSIKLSASQDGTSLSLDLTGTSDNKAIDLSGFTDGKVVLTAAFDNVTGGGVTIWWE